MLAVACALVCEPSLPMIDELSMGLAPILVEGFYELMANTADQQAMAIIIIEQFAHEVLGLKSTAAVMVHGRIALVGSSSEVADSISDAHLASTAGEVVPRGSDWE